MPPPIPPPIRPPQRVPPERFHLPVERGVIAVSGEDRQSFLQGLISNDTARIAPDQAIYATLLTAQGRFLFDLFLVQ